MGQQEFVPERFSDGYFIIENFLKRFSTKGLRGSGMVLTRRHATEWLHASAHFCIQQKCGGGEGAAGRGGGQGKMNFWLPSDHRSRARAHVQGNKDTVREEKMGWEKLANKQRSVYLFRGSELKGGGEPSSNVFQLGVVVSRFSGVEVVKKGVQGNGGTGS